MNRFDRWIDDRMPRVPPGFRDWLSVSRDDSVTAASLTSLGVDALGVADPARRLDRPTAFRLLAADAFITYACEEAADADDVSATLESVLDRLVAARRDE